MDQGWPDGDGSNDLGWRVTTDEHFGCICTVRPSYLYFGK